MDALRREWREPPLVLVMEGAVIDRLMEAPSWALALEPSGRVDLTVEEMAGRVATVFGTEGPTSVELDQDGVLRSEFVADRGQAGPFECLTAYVFPPVGDTREHRLAIFQVASATAAVPVTLRARRTG